MKRYLTSLLLLLTAVVCFNSCDEDIMDEIALQGKCWRVAHTTGDCPYEPGDRFSFYSNNKFVVTGADDLIEAGTWKVKKGKLQMSFARTEYEIDIEAPIPELNDNHCTLVCYDYDYDINYELELYHYSDLDE